MITRSFPRQRLGESVWVPNPVQGMAFFGFLKLFACWYGSKQNKLPSKIQWINMWQDSSLEDIQSIEKTKLHRSWKSISPITPILQSQTSNQTPLPNQQLNPTTNISRFNHVFPSRVAVSVNPHGTLLTPVFIRNISKACWLLSTKFCAPFTTLSKPSAWRTWRNETTTPKVCYLPHINPTINISYIDRLNSL